MEYDSHLSNKENKMTHGKKTAFEKIFLKKFDVLSSPFRALS